jgi:hypothetical protein
MAAMAEVPAGATHLYQWKVHGGSAVPSPLVFNAACLRIASAIKAYKV